MFSNALAELIVENHCTNNRKELEESKMAICIYELRIFKASEITQYIKGETTALCPHCHVDLVLGDKYFSLDSKFIGIIQHRRFCEYPKIIHGEVCYDEYCSHKEH